MSAEPPEVKLWRLSHLIGKGKFEGEGFMKKIYISVIMFFALVAVSDTILANVNNEYDTALQYYYKGKYEKAIRLFKVYAKDNPVSSVYYYIGYALYKIKKYDEANKYFKMSYLVDPTFSPKQMISLQKHKQTGKEIREPQRKKDSSKIPSVAKSKEKQMKGGKWTSVKEEERSKRMVLLTLIYILAHKKV
jgi:tetratricopeptide (TPR) repeat protein